MVNISFFIYKTGFFGPFHMLQKKKKSKEISRQIRFFPQKSACLPNSRSFAKRPSRQIWRRHGHRNDGKMVNRPHRWNNMEIVVSLLQYWLCTAVVFWLFFFFFCKSRVRTFAKLGLLFSNTHTTSSHPFLVMAPKREVGYWCKLFLVYRNLTGLSVSKAPISFFPTCTYYSFSELGLCINIDVTTLSSLLDTLCKL